MTHSRGGQQTPTTRQQPDIIDGNRKPNRHPAVPVHSVIDAPLVDKQDVDSPPVTPAAADVPAVRRFGYWSGHLVVVGSMIGAGILTTSGYTLRETGNPHALIGLWILGGLLALCGAVTVAEIATTLPRSGGDYVFVREAFGPTAGFVSGWATFAIGFAASTAFVADFALTYLLAPFGDAIPPWANRLAASALILIIGAVHTLGHTHSSRLQSIATIITIAVLLGLAFGGICCGHGDWSHMSNFKLPTGSHWWALAVGLIYVSYAYTGWNAAAYLAGELRNPARNLPRCLIGGTATVMLLYLLVNLAYVYALNPDTLSEMSEEDVGPVARLAVEALFGRSAADIVAAILGLTLVASVSAYLLTGPRVAFAMARDRMFPGFAGRLHPTRGTTAAATLTQAVLAAALVWTGSSADLLDYAAVGLAVLAGLTVASVFPIRRRRDLIALYRLPLYPLPPLIYLGFTGWTVAGMLIDPEKRTAALLSICTLLLGIPLYLLIGEPIRNAKSAGS